MPYFRFNSFDLKLSRKEIGDWVIQGQSQAQIDAGEPVTEQRRTWRKLRCNWTDRNGNATVGQLRKLLDKIGDEDAHISMVEYENDDVHLSIETLEIREASPATLAKHAKKLLDDLKRQEELREWEKARSKVLGGVMERSKAARRVRLAEELSTLDAATREVQEELTEAMNPEVGLINSDVTDGLLQDLQTIDNRRQEILAEFRK